MSFQNAYASSGLTVIEPTALLSILFSLATVSQWVSLDMPPSVFPLSDIHRISLRVCSVSMVTDCYVRLGMLPGQSSPAPPSFEDTVVLALGQTLP